MSIPPREFDGDHGFVSVVVLAALMVVSGLIAIATSFAASATERVSALSDYLADDVASTSLGMRLLMDLRLGSASVARDSLGTVPLAGGGHATVSLESEAAKINFMLIDPLVLDKYARNGDAAELSAALRDLRARSVASKDEIAHLWLEARRLLLPTAQFAPSDFSSLNPLAGVDPVYANRRVLSALPDLTPEEVSAILERPPGAPVGVHSDYFASGVSRFTIVVRIDWNDGSAFEQRWPIELTSTGATVFLGRGPN